LKNTRHPCHYYSIIFLEWFWDFWRSISNPKTWILLTIWNGVYMNLTYKVH
jgi:hypothetical protein